jgi:hypothetical protein
MDLTEAQLNALLITADGALRDQRSTSKHEMIRLGIRKKKEASQLNHLMRNLRAGEEGKIPSLHISQKEIPQ